MAQLEGQYMEGLRLFYLKKYDEAVACLTAAAEAGDSKSQHFLAMMYESGNGVERDYGKAAHWYRETAEQGDREAQLTYAVICVLGNKGVEADYPTACHYACLALHQGNEKAAQTLQIARSQSAQAAAEAVEAFKAAHLAGDTAEALVQLERAAECGDADAQFALAQLLYAGKGVAEDKPLALLWLRDAAEQGHAQAQKQLSELTDTEENYPEESVDYEKETDGESIDAPVDEGSAP